jgi:hypothetical protein
MGMSGSQLGTLGGTAASLGLNAAGFASSGGLLGLAAGPVGMIAMPLLFGLLGGLFDEGPDVQGYIDEMAKLYEGILPPDLSKAIVYAQYKQGGSLTPQQLSELPIEAQQAVQLVESPEFKQKQKVQLQQLEQLAQTGMGPQEIFALEQSRRAAAGDAQARFKSLMQQYQQMGQAGGGASLAAQLQSAQAADDREAMTNMQAAAMAAENRRNAIQQAFTAASGMRQQDLQVNQYNTENRRQKQMFDIQNAMTRQQQNAQYANQANMYNLQRQQQVADMNLQQLNQEIYRQQFLAPQQMFQNQMAIANAKAGVLAQKAGLAQQQAQMQSQADMNFMMGAAQLGLGVNQMQQNNRLLDIYAQRGVPSMANVATAPIPSSDSFTMPQFAPSPAPQNRFSLGFNNDFSNSFQQQMGPVMPQMAPVMPTAPNFNWHPPMQIGTGGNQAGIPFNQPLTFYSPYGTRT